MIQVFGLDSLSESAAKVDLSGWGCFGEFLFKVFWDCSLKRLLKFCNSGKAESRGKERRTVEKNTLWVDSDEKARRNDTVKGFASRAAEKASRPALR